MHRIVGIVLRCVVVTAMAVATSGVALAHGDAAPEPTVAGLLAAWSLDPLPWVGLLVAALGYLMLVKRVDRAHPRTRVPRSRIVFWLAGLLAIWAALISPVDAYADSLLTIHMVQHLLLAMVAPPLLALGAPVTLLLRASTPDVRQRLILPVLHSRAVVVLTSPLVAWPLFAIVMWSTHFSALYNLALEDPTVHILEHVIFLGVGLFFWWPIVAADPIPRRMGYGGRLSYVGLQMPLNAAVGLAIYFAPTVLYAHYASIERSWGPDALTDQQIGGLLMWAAGDLILLLALPLLVTAWMRADVRRSEQLDAQLAAQLAARRAPSATSATDFGQST